MNVNGVKAQSISVHICCAIKILKGVEKWFVIHVYKDNLNWICFPYEDIPLCLLYVFKPATAINVRSALLFWWTSTCSIICSFRSFALHEQHNTVCSSPCPSIGQTVAATEPSRTLQWMLSAGEASHADKTLQTRSQRASYESQEVKVGCAPKGWEEEECGYKMCFTWVLTRKI